MEWKTLAPPPTDGDESNKILLYGVVGMHHTGNVVVCVRQKCKRSGHHKFSRRFR